MEAFAPQAPENESLPRRLTTMTPVGGLDEMRPVQMQTAPAQRTPVVQQPLAPQTPIGGIPEMRRLTSWAGDAAVALLLPVHVPG